MEVSKCLLTKCVWGIGMLQVVFNIEMVNYYRKCTFNVTPKVRSMSAVCDKTSDLVKSFYERDSVGKLQED